MVRSKRTHNALTVTLLNKRGRERDCRHRIPGTGLGHQILNWHVRKLLSDRIGVALSCDDVKVRAQRRQPCNRVLDERGARSQQID